MKTQGRNWFGEENEEINYEHAECVMPVEYPKRGVW